MTVKKKILVVDDDANFRALLECVFLDHFDVLLAGGGEEAFRAAVSGMPDIILTDVMMPDGSGIELARRLNSGETRKIPVFVLTGTHFNPTMQGLFMEEGNVIGFLDKTAPLDEILGRIRDALAERGDREGAP